MRGTQIRVLLVEDNPADARLVQELLAESKRERFDVVWVDRLQEAKMQVELEEFDVVLLDLGLPDFNGQDTFDSMSFACEVPIVILTGRSDEELAISALKVGVQDYLHKTGLNGDALVRALRYALVRAGHQKDMEEVTSMLLELKDEEGSGHKAVVPGPQHIVDVARLQGALEQSTADLEQLAYVASHDLQEPLRMVTSYLQLLQRRYEGQLDADADEFIGFAVDGSQRMQAMLDALLAYSRINTRGTEFEETDCEMLLDRIMSALQRKIDDVGGTIERDPLPTVKADEAQLGQVFQQLVDNALKFRSDALPQVHIGSERSGDEWLFSVRDNGIGIEPGSAERIFNLFQRLHARDDIPGGGVGLALCKRIIQRHGGRIWVESAGENGSRLCFTIPEEKSETRSLQERD